MTDVLSEWVSWSSKSAISLSSPRSSLLPAVPVLGAFVRLEGSCCLVLCCLVVFLFICFCFCFCFFVLCFRLLCVLCVNMLYVTVVYIFSAVSYL